MKYVGPDPYTDAKDIIWGSMECNIEEATVREKEASELRDKANRLEKEALTFRKANEKLSAQLALLSAQDEGESRNG